MDATPATVEQINEYLGTLLNVNISAVSLPADMRQLMVLWGGYACDKAGTLTVSASEDAITVAPDPITNCDLAPSYRGVVLTFAEPQAAGSFRLDLRPTKVLGA